MSTEETEEVKGPANWRVLGVVAGSVLGLVLFVLLLVGRSPTKTEQTTPGGEKQESGLAEARQRLLKAGDLATCKNALNDVNTHFSRFPESRPPGLEKTQAAALRQQASLEPDEVEEIASNAYSRLDAYHLEQCLLLRDAARWLDSRGQAARAADPPGLEQAAAAFDWVIRQVRLGKGVAWGKGPAWVPPALVLRRGWGTELDRALIFLALLEQVGSPDGRQQHLHGCLLFLPNPEKKPSWECLWACGVVVGDGRDVYLFDPRLGMALPGPEGKGIATLAQARQGPKVFDQLATDKARYDVTPEQARAAEVCLVCSLSALAPRMKYLQDAVLAPAVEVHLAQDVPGDLDRLKAAAGAAVPVWPEGTAILRRFLPAEEGGVKNLPDDNAVAMPTRQQRFVLEMVPWQDDFPPLLRDPHNFPGNAPLGQKVRNDFANPFLRGNLEAGQPRDLLLRGQHAEAVQQLVGEHRDRQQQRQRLAASGDVVGRLRPWIPRVLAVYADQARARTQQEHDRAAVAIAQLWGEAEDFRILLEGALAGPRDAEVVYQLALCKQEQAERLQARLDRAAGKAPANPADVEMVAGTWRDALFWWKEFTEGPASQAQPAARRLRGRAQAMLGDWQGAVASWQDLSPSMTELEKLASLYRARQVARQHVK
jgi:hypothetical protein